MTKIEFWWPFTIWFSTFWTTVQVKMLWNREAKEYWTTSFDKRFCLGTNQIWESDCTDKNSTKCKNKYKNFVKVNIGKEEDGGLLWHLVLTIATGALENKDTNAHKFNPPPHSNHKLVHHPYIRAVNKWLTYGGKRKVLSLERNEQ